MANQTINLTLPPLPNYQLKPLPPLISGLPDQYLALALPVIAYWVVSLFFHFIDEWDLFPQYRLHTPAELLKRNHASRWDVFRDVILQQLVQTMVGVTISLLEPPPVYGKEAYDIAWWAKMIRLSQRGIPVVLGAVGVNAYALAGKMSSSHGNLASALVGGSYPQFTQMVGIAKGAVAIPAFAPWEIWTAKAIYHVIFPALQMTLAVFILDSWQYFVHRAMHLNKWLYTTFHSRHHRLYVPYAYGALYNHPLEGLFMDTLGTGVAYLGAGLTVRQCMWFFTIATIKTVDDHCGYAFPWDPLQHLTGNNAAYHDVHHQSWGIKTNFSQPFFTFWDSILGTKWTGGDVSLRYERARCVAQKKLDADLSASSSGTQTPTTNSAADLFKYKYKDEVAEASTTAYAALQDAQPVIPAGKASRQAIASRQAVLDDAHGGAEVIAAETAEEIKEQQQQQQQRLRSSPRKRTTNSGLKGLADRVGESLQGTSAVGCGPLVSPVDGGKSRA